MNRFIDIFFNFPLVVSGIAWLIAQLLKTVVSIVTERRLNFVSLMASGGMPSSHSATVCALAISIGLTQGFRSPLFAIAFLFAYTVMYDAAGVRRETGEQAKILNKILVDLAEGNTDEMPKELKELVGHTPLQVFAGAVLGIVIAVAAKYIVYGVI